MNRHILLAHVAAIGLSAALLFSIQPLVARLILPTFGGAPAVWNTAVVFFQILLLAGYAYAHLSVRLLREPAQVAVHAVLLILAFVVLPAAAPPVMSGDVWRSAHPVVSVLLLLLALIGLPFLTMAATAPLLQHWFSRSSSPHARDPYFLYAASNAGAILALVAYPTVIEPVLSLTLQQTVWAGGFVVTGLLIVACGVLSHRSRPRGSPASEPRAVPPAPAPALAWRARLRWIALSAVGSATLLGVTLHISTDVAAVPFLWVIPLTIFLASFVLTFARRPPFRHEHMLTAQVWVYLLLGVYFAAADFVLALVLHLLVLFVTVMVCHGELARSRPDARRLTEFYLWISVGGVLGGIASSVVAPLLFDSVVEYPLAIIAACLLRPHACGEPRVLRAADLALPAVLLAAFLASEGVPALNPSRIGAAGPLLFLAAMALALFWFRARPVRFALGLCVLVFSAHLVPVAATKLARERSFFGVYKVDAINDGSVHVLRHGTTVHGAQPWRPAQFSRHALTYYSVEGPVGQIFATLTTARRLDEVAIVGLGVGTLACYRQPGQRFRFYEIDPLVVRIARDERWFRYLSLCHEGNSVKVGDGRVLLAGEPASEFDLIVLDAFSSDAIPMHLLTTEAVAMYASRLAPGGVLAFHISNKFVRLGPVLGAVAGRTALHARIQRFEPAPDAERRGALGSTWVILAKQGADLAVFDGDPRWESLAAQAGAEAWSDDYADLFQALIWRRVLWRRGASAQ